MTLGGLLKAARTNQGKTLREVERLTGISNGYLSQLESDSIQQPSPRHLHKLASEYAISYAELMESAGYATPVAMAAPPLRSKRRPAGVGATAAQTEHLPGLDELTDEDRRKIQAYIDDLRAARRARAGK